MNPFPAERSVLVLDNCRIHHNEELYDLVRDAGELSRNIVNTSLLKHDPVLKGCLLLYLPPYSPDLNPIEESFSARMLFTGISDIEANNCLVKAYLRRHAHRFRDDDDPIGVLIEACACITPKMSKGWFRHAGCIVD